MLKFWKHAKCIQNQGLNKCQYCFANISVTKARIVMKFYMVVIYYLVLIFMNIRAQMRDTSCKRARAHAEAV